MTRPPIPSSAAGKARPYHKGNVAADLREVAERILATERLEHATLRRLTREVGVAPANFYNHFESLDALLFGIAADAFEEVTALAAAAWSRPGPKSDRLVAVAVAFVRFAVRNKELMRVMFGRVAHERHEEFRAAATGAFEQLVGFIYDESFVPGPSAMRSRRFGIAYGFFTLCYGLARTISAGLLDVDVEDEAELASFVEESVRPFLDGTAGAALASGNGAGGRSRMAGQKRSLASTP